MRRAYHRWFSPSLGRDMELLVFGHAGARLLAFPASQHPFYDWEDRGLVAALRWHVENGHLQLFCLDQVDDESWYAQHLHPSRRALRYAQYEKYVVEEVVPFTLRENGNPFLIAAGPSLGAYHAATFAFRHPHLVGRLLGMSGIYDIKRFTEDHYDENVYSHNPLDFLADEGCAGRIAAMKRMDVILMVGRHDPLLGQNEQLSTILWAKDVWHALRIWDGFAHDWPTWARALPLYVGGHD